MIGRPTVSGMLDPDICWCLAAQSLWLDNALVGTDSERDRVTSVELWQGAQDEFGSVDGKLPITRLNRTGLVRAFNDRLRRLRSDGRTGRNDKGQLVYDKVTRFELLPVRKAFRPGEDANPILGWTNATTDFGGAHLKICEFTERWTHWRGCGDVRHYSLNGLMPYEPVRRTRRPR